MLILWTVREERGANTEPTGLGMERWYVKYSIFLRTFQSHRFAIRTDGMGWGPSRLFLHESFSQICRFKSSMDTFFAGVRDVRQSLHYPSFPKMKF